MRKKILLSLGLLVLAGKWNAQNSHKCATEEQYQLLLQKHPELAQVRAEQEAEMAKLESQKSGSKSTSSLITYIVPVVVHVIHQYGSENISDAQIEDQIRILNEDFKRKNSDSVNTPAAFNNILGRMSIEFRLARKDPNNNCTNGIVRVVNPLTNGTSSFSNRDDVKALSYWPATKYLNIWIVKNITPFTAGQVILGYAQFPGLGALNTEGLVLRSDATGSIGTAVAPTNKGRTATHEIGHCLGLRHIWGDDGTACTGSDFVTDTPNQADENYGCPTFPQISCSNGPNGDMFMNYMDYVDDACMNAFTAGQVNRMNNTMNSSVGGRSSLIVNANLIATGTDVPNAPIVCKPKPEFTSTKTQICSGSTITFTDKSWGTSATAWSWTFAGGTPSTSNTSTATITYNTPGTYDVKLVVSNAAGTDSIIKIGEVLVQSSTANIQAPNFIETFPSNFSFANSNFKTVDIDNDLTFTPYSGAGVGDNSCIYIDNGINSANKTDYLYLPTINFSSAPSDVKLTFYLAYQRDFTPRTDKLLVQTSINCGVNWSNRFNKAANNAAATALYTVSAINTTGVFTPVASSWRKETVNLTGLPANALATRTEVRFAFTSDNTVGIGLPLYIDSIAYTSASLGIKQVFNTKLTASIYPNPNNGELNLWLDESDKKDISVEVKDVIGRTVIIVKNDEIKQSNNNNVYRLDLKNKLFNGTYFVTIKANNKSFTDKLIINQ